jgi:hypothetical protein
MSAFARKLTALAIPGLALFRLAGCSSNDAVPPATGGSSSSTGGQSGSSGGTPATTGGTSVSTTGGTGVSTTGGTSVSTTGGTSVSTTGGVGPTAGNGSGGTLGGSTGTGGQVSSGGGNSGGNCVLPNLPDVSALPAGSIKLPDPFTFFDGTKVTTKAQWECRRKEILAMAAKYLYGPVPGDCDEVSGSVSGSTVNITCKVGGKSADFSVSITGSGKSINVDLSSGILPQGKSMKVTGNDSKIKTLYGLSEINPNIANAWTINRVMDVLEKNPTAGLDPKTIAVSGCSGCGKGAFLAGVFSRAPIVVIVESGGGGATSWRMTEWFRHGEGKSRWMCGDPPQGIDDLEDSGICGPWVTSVAKPLRDKPALVNNLPFDQHMLIATIAPRYLVHFTNNNGKNSWCHLAGTSEALADWAAHSVYKALGVEKNHSFEIYSGGHCGVGDTGIAAAMFKRALDGDMTADTGKQIIPDDHVQVPMSEWKGLFVDWNMDTVLQ